MEPLVSNIRGHAVMHVVSVFQAMLQVGQMSYGAWAVAVLTTVVVNGVAEAAAELTTA
tara:strand:- start:411 stop:584 length:174 start_codon:yes stop_codon:yes gene_type:complete